MEEIQNISEKEKQKPDNNIYLKELKKISSLRDSIYVKNSKSQSNKFIHNYQQQEKRALSPRVIRRNKFREKISNMRLSHSSSIDEKFEKIKNQKNKFQTGIGTNQLFKIFDNKSIKKEKLKMKLLLKISIK